MTKTAKAKNLICIILAVLCVLNIWIISAESKQGIGLLSNLPFAFIPVTGTSMEPDYGEGDAVFAVQTSYEKLKVGDRVIYSYGTDLVVHEIVEFTDTGMVTKGIANEVTDAPVLQSQYKARVLCKIPALGAVWRISSKPVSFGVFAVLITVIIFGKDIFSEMYKVIFKDR